MQQEANGNNNILIGIAQGATIAITQFLNKSADYQELIRKRTEKIELLQYLNDLAADYKVKVLQEISEIEDQIRQFKEEIIRLAKQFLRVEINTERYAIAKNLFEKGDLAGARAALNEQELNDELTQLQRQKADLAQEVEEINQKLKQISDECLLKASLCYLNFQNPDHIKEAEAMYKKAITAYKTHHALYDLGLFYSGYNQKDRAIVCFEESLNFCKNNFGLQIISIYAIGTCYLTIDKAKSRDYLEKAINLCNENNMEDPLFLSILGNALHNLGETYWDETQETRINILKKAVSIRKKTVLIENKANSLLAYTLGSLLECYFINGDTRSLEMTYEDALEAMERFSISDLSTHALIFQTGCLSKLIMGTALLYSLNKVENIPSYLKRIEPLLAPFEQYVYVHHKEDSFAIAKAYEQYMNFFMNEESIYSDRNKIFYKKSIKYYREALRFQKPNDDIYEGLALNLTFLGFKEIIDGNKNIGHQLHKEALEYYKKIEIITDDQQEFKLKLENFMLIECNCEECVAERIKSQNQ